MAATRRHRQPGLRRPSRAPRRHHTLSANQFSTVSDTARPPRACRQRVPTEVEEIEAVLASVRAGRASRRTRAGRGTAHRARGDQQTRRQGDAHRHMHPQQSATGPVQVRDRSVDTMCRRGEADGSNPRHVDAPFAGVASLGIGAGDEVAAGVAVVAIEAMKMEATIAAPVAWEGHAAGDRLGRRGRTRRPAGRDRLTQRVIDDTAVPPATSMPTIRTAVPSAPPRQPGAADPPGQPKN